MEILPSPQSSHQPGTPPRSRHRAGLESSQDASSLPLGIADGSRVENRSLLIQSGWNWPLQTLSREGRVHVSPAIISTWENMVVASGEDGQRGAQGQRKGRDPPGTHRDVGGLHTRIRANRASEGEKLHGCQETEAEAWSKAGADPVAQRRPPGSKALHAQLHPAPHPLHVQPMASGTPACIFPINPPFVLQLL